jgi:hypothetical protein
MIPPPPGPWEFGFDHAFERAGCVPTGVRVVAEAEAEERKRQQRDRSWLRNIKALALSHR